MPSLMAILGLDGSQFKAGLDNASKMASSAGEKITESWGHHLKEGLAGMVTLGALERVIHSTLEYGEQVSMLSQRLGIGTDAVQAWDYALKMNGTSIGDQAKTFEKLAMSRKKAMEGDDKMLASFRALGVTVDDLKSKRLEDVMLQIAEAFQAGDPQKLIADLREVGGKGVGQLVAAFRDGLPDLVKEAKDMGVVMGEEVVNGLREAGDKSKTVWMEIVAGVAPAVNWLAGMVQGLWRGLSVAATATMGLALGLMPGSGGPSKVADEMVKELEDQYKAQDEAAETRAKNRKKGFAGGADEEESKKAGREADRTAKRKEELAERLAKLQDKHYLDGLTKEERINELHRKRAELAAMLATNWSKMSTENQLKAQIDLEEMKGEEERAARELEKPKAGKHAQLSVNSLQAIGAYAAESPREQQMLDTTRRSEGHLREIKDHLVKSQGMAGNHGVRY